MTAKKSINYQKLQAELDELLAALQAGDMDIDEATNAYVRGQEIVDELSAYLKSAENKVTKLTKDFS